MKNLKQFSEGVSAARKKAEAQGLEYRGFGYWADPNTGEVVARSSGDELKDIKHDPLESKAGAKEEPLKRGAGSYDDMVAQAAPEVQMGEVKPGEEKAKKENEWESGPDGSTDVGTKKNEVEKDVFVDKDQDENSWVAGPDGSNHKNFSFDSFKESALKEGWLTDAEKENQAELARLDAASAEKKAKKAEKEKQIANRADGKKSAAEIAREKGWRSDGHGVWFDTMDNPVAKTVAGELVMLTSAEQEMERGKVIARNVRKPEDAKMTGDPDAVDGAEYIRRHGAKAARNKNMQGMTDVLHGWMKDVGLDPEKDDPKLNPLAAKRAIPAKEPVEDEDLDDGNPSREDLIARLMNGEIEPDDERTFKDAKDALKSLDPKVRDKLLAKIGRTQTNSFVRKSKQGKEDKAIAAYKQIVQTPALAKDELAVQELNNQVQEFITDPNFDMSEANRYHELGEGAFGTVYLSRDLDHVIKEGEIGEEEMKALDLLKDMPEFPTLVNAEFTDTFKHKSSAYNNPMQADDEHRRPGESKYWNPEEESDFEKKFPSARGTYAMTLAKGDGLNDVLYNIEADYGEDSEQTYQVEQNFWSTMAKLHKAGVSHNDLHGGNVFVDDDLGVNFLDLGLAKVNRLTAFMEALASLNGNNYQLAMRMEFLNLNNLALKQTLEYNKQILLSTIEEDYADYDDDETTSVLEEMLEGEIRMHGGAIGMYYDVLQLDEQQLQKYIDILYEGILPYGEEPEEDNSLEARMERGYNDMVDRFGEDNPDVNMSGKSALDMIRVANNLRKERGEEPINVKGLEIPSK